MRMHLLWMIILALTAVSCAPAPILQPTPTPTSVAKQGEPVQPLIGGQLSGLSENVQVTIYIRTPQGRIVSWGGAKAGVPWQAIVHKAGGTEYMVTAEAEGYVSQPVSYTIHISGDTAYVVRNGQVTDEGAIYLDFHFVPKDSP
jgi:hypothetical protein